VVKGNRVSVERKKGSRGESRGRNLGGQGERPGGENQDAAKGYLSIQPQNLGHGILPSNI